MRLVIAEKPSVAKSLAAVLGAATRKDGYLEGGGWLVSWCLGHLAGLADAATYNPDYAKWRYDDLPILPEPWQMVVSKDKKKQFDILKQLMNAPDVTEVANACDAGREGELIFRSVYELAGCQKPMKRLWISSMEDSAIREGFASLHPGADYDGLRDAALCRAKADWLVGINATRLFSVLYHRTLNIGRVMSPTLALIVQREAEIDAFKPVPFYTVALDLLGFTAASARMDKKADAEQLKSACQGGTVTVKQVERRDKSEKPPALYDLTNPAYAPECWITLITKGVMGLVAGLAMADREEPKYGRCTVSAALGCVAYYILYFFKSFAYDGLLMGGLTAATAAAALPLKIPASLFNGAVAIILAPPLCVALRHALKKAHIQLP